MSSNINYTHNNEHRFTSREVLNEVNKKAYYYTVRSNINSKVVQDFFLIYTNIKEKRGHDNQWTVRIRNGITLVNSELYEDLLKHILSPKVHSHLLDTKDHVFHILRKYNG